MAGRKSRAVIKRVSFSVFWQPLREFYTKKDGGRKNELTTEIRCSLNAIANRIDKGYNIEVRVRPITHEDEGQKVKTEDAKNIDIILTAAKALQFLKVGGDPVLGLPESVSALPAEKKTRRKKKELGQRAK